MFKKERKTSNQKKKKVKVLFFTFSGAISLFAHKKLFFCLFSGIRSIEFWKNQRTKPKEREFDDVTNTIGEQMIVGK